MAAASHARVVLEVVNEATDGQVFDKICDALPDDIADLVRAGSTD